MLQIAVNLFLCVLWAALTALLTVGISILSKDNPDITGGTAFGMWLLGELVILSPFILLMWKRRRYEFE